MQNYFGLLIIIIILIVAKYEYAPYIYCVQHKCAMLYTTKYETTTKFCFAHGLLCRNYYTKKQNKTKKNTHIINSKNEFIYIYMLKKFSFRWTVVKSSVNYVDKLKPKFIRHLQTILAVLYMAF